MLTYRLLKVQSSLAGAAALDTLHVLIFGSNASMRERRLIAYRREFAHPVRNIPAIKVDTGVGMMVRSTLGGCKGERYQQSKVGHKTTSRDAIAVEAVIRPYPVDQGMNPGAACDDDTTMLMALCDLGIREWVMNTSDWNGCISLRPTPH